MLLGIISLSAETNAALRTGISSGKLTKTFTSWLVLIMLVIIPRVFNISKMKSSQLRSLQDTGIKPQLPHLNHMGTASLCHRTLTRLANMRHARHLGSSCSSGAMPETCFRGVVRSGHAYQVCILTVRARSMLRAHGLNIYRFTIAPSRNRRPQGFIDMNYDICFVYLILFTWKTLQLSATLTKNSKVVTKFQLSGMLPD